MRLSLTNLFTRNLGLKLLALGIAIVLWFMAVGRERAEVGFNVPLELVNIPPSLVIVNQVPDGVSVRIHGSVALTRQVSERKLRFSLDLSGATTGPNRFILQPESLNLPRELRVTRVSPDVITVELEKLAVKAFSVLPVIKGEPVAGYVIEEINLEPKTVEVRGPVSLVDRLDVIWTNPIDVTTLSAPATLQTKPSLPDMMLSVVKPTTIQVKVKVGEKITVREFKEVPVEVMQAPGEGRDYRVTPQTVTLVVRGPVNSMSALVTGAEMKVRVNLAGLEPGQYERMPIVALPSNMEVVKIEPRVLTVKVFEGGELK
ncbi:MAG: CdaR family protein [Thermodesulfobacteriota bacterium]